MSVEYLGLIFTILVQAAGSIWWAATLHGKVSTLERRLGGLEKDQRQQDLALAKIEATLARLDERSSQIVDAVNRLETRLGALGK